MVDWLYRWRIAISAGVVLGAVILVPRANVTHVDNDLRAWFSEDDPFYRDYDRFRAEFAGTQPLIVALRVDAGTQDAGDIFTTERLTILRDLTEDLERIPTVARVQSLATATVVRSRPTDSLLAPAEDSLELKPLVDLSRRSPDETRTLALADTMLRGELVSADGTVVAIVVTFDEDRFNEARSDILARIYSAVGARLRPGMSAYYNGSIEINETYNRVTVQNQRRFVPPILVLTVIAIYILFRSVGRALIVLFSIVVSVVWTLGLYSLMGFGFNILTAMLTPLVVVLAISDDVHIIQEYDRHRRRTTAEEAFKTTASYLFAPLLGASGTTALGLLSLTTSDVVAIRHFGVGAAIGVMIDFVVSLILVPTLLGLLASDPRVPTQDRVVAESLRRVAAYATRRARLVLGITAGTIVIALIGIARLQVDTNHIRFFDRTHPLSVSADLIDSKLAGVYSFHVLLEGPPEVMKSVDVVRRIDQLAAAIEKWPEVRKTTSMADHVKRANQELHSGRPDAAVVPDDPLVLAQELFLVALTSDGRRELERVVSSDYSTAQIVARLPSMSSGRVFQLIEDAQRLATETFSGTSVRATATGSGRLFSALDHYIVRSQISSFATALLTILAAMFLIFRSARFGLLALAPNVLPVIAVLGAMGWFGISINIATVMLASVALGVVDDDTVHFIHRFRHELACGHGIDAAAPTAAALEGRAAFTTALINSCGFAVLMLSVYKPSAWFGGLLALTLFIAFLSEVLVLPALVSVSRRFFV